MRFGSLDGVIDIEHKVLTGVSTSNEPVYEWRTWREDVFVGVKAKRGNEYFDNDSKHRYSETVTQFRAHLTDVDGMDAAMRIKFEGQYYDIKNVLPDYERKQDCLIDAVIQGGAVQGVAFAMFADPALTGEVGVIYQTLISIVGGQAPYSVALSDEGSPSPMPLGLSLVQAQEKIWALEGVPMEVGSFPINVRATDALGRAATLPQFTLAISPSE